ncbi:unnamed protein product [Penicillium salamii]|nr:unnamed protein product [Penicillium salamii]CAG8382610.1 unnamed protein product [Penicillium salamii]
MLAVTVVTVVPRQPNRLTWRSWTGYFQRRTHFFGHMFGHTEQDVIDRGLQHALLVPGYTKKFSGNLQAGSAEEANAMGLIGASRIEWGLLQG